MIIVLLNLRIMSFLTFYACKLLKFMDLNLSNICIYVHVERYSRLSNITCTNICLFIVIILILIRRQDRPKHDLIPITHIGNWIWLNNLATYRLRNTDLIVPVKIHEDDILLRYFICIVSRTIPTFQRCLLPPPSRLIALMMEAVSTFETSVYFC
jgi:hypothetical protein